MSGSDACCRVVRAGGAGERRGAAGASSAEVVPALEPSVWGEREYSVCVCVCVCVCVWLGSDGARYVSTLHVSACVWQGFLCGTGFHWSQTPLHGTGLGSVIPCRIPAHGSLVVSDRTPFFERCSRACARCVSERRPDAPGVVHLLPDVRPAFPATEQQDAQPLGRSLRAVRLH